MAHVIIDSCVGCKDTACVEVCPMDCIHPTGSEPGFDAADQLYINPDECIDCGLCPSECPVDAIFLDDELPQDKRHFIEINADWFKGRDDQP